MAMSDADHKYLDCARHLQAYNQAAVTLNLLCGLTTGARCMLSDPQRMLRVFVCVIHACATYLGEMIDE